LEERFEYDYELLQGLKTIFFYTADEVGYTDYPDYEEAVVL
jgi:hypothetical protein